MRVALLIVPLVVLAPLASTAAPFWARWQLACQEPTFAWPVGRRTAYALRADAHGSGAFGARRGGGRTHNGIDLAASVGTPVAAAKSGVARVGRVHNGMGTYLEVHHPDGSVALYGHLASMAVADGQRVRRGQPIGTVGKSGNARSRQIQPHLHFELRLHGVPVDPLDGYLDGTEPAA